MKKLSIIGFLLLTCSVFSQSKLDNTLTTIKNVDDTTKIIKILELGRSAFNTSTDSALFYFRMAEELAGNSKSIHEKFQFFEAEALRFAGIAQRRNGDYEQAISSYTKALEIMLKGDFINGAATCYRNIGNVYYFQGLYDDALNIYRKTLNLYAQINDKDGLAGTYLNLGNIFEKQGNYQRAIENYHKALALYEETGKDAGIAACYTNIGIIHHTQNNLVDALDYLQKSILFKEKIGDKRSTSISLVNLGNVYHALSKDEDSEKDKLHLQRLAKATFEKSLALKSDINDKFGMSACYNNIGEIYNTWNITDSARYFYLKSLDIDLEINNQKGIASSYKNLSSLALENHDFSQSIRFAHQGLDIASEIGALPELFVLYRNLIHSYASIGKYQKAYSYFSLYNNTSDSLYSQSRSKTISELEIKYQTEKKEQEIEKQKLLILQEQTELSKQKILRNSFILAFLLTIVIASAIYKGYTNKIKANKLITEQNSELEQANAEILAQRDELETQRDTVVNQNKQLEEINSKITQSIQYAQSIQAAILPSEKILEQISPYYFVIMKPCELVSGDFFWATIFDEYQVFCVADCTGHGVPGAFMSILGITALNDIVTKHRIIKPSEILGDLRDNVIEALSKNNPEHLHKDGMDIALCVYNSKTKELQFAGAGLSLWIINDNEAINNKSSQLTENGFALHEIKGDAMPVGLSPLTKPFSNHVVKINKMVSLYMVTDGYTDQLKSTKKVKLGANRLKSLILENTHKPFEEQSSIFEDYFDEWKGAGIQIDDVTMLGIKLME